MNDSTDDRTILEKARASRKPAAATAGSPCLTVIAGGTVGKVHSLPLGKATVIGRASETDLPIEDGRVSRRHAKISVDAKGTAMVEDLGSSNGTFVNGARVQRQQLKEGDKLQFGPGPILKFSYQSEAEQKELAGRAIKDPLTDIYTEQYLLDRIDTEYAYARRHKTELALLMLEADDFQSIASAHGASAGEHVLKELANLVKHALRAEDVLARYGEIAFAVLARDVPDAGALIVAQRLRRAAKAHNFVFGKTQIPVTISIGMATASDDAKTPAKLIDIAEKYLRRAQAAKNSIGGKAVKALVQRDDNNSAVTIRYS
jgi:two-component system cell cycle response regulator